MSTSLGDDDDTFVVTGPYGPFTIDAVALDMTTGLPAREGLCARLIEPERYDGAGAQVLGETVVAPGGQVSFQPITTASSWGVWVEVADCDEADTTVYTSLTIVDQPLYFDKVDASVAVVAYSLDLAMVARVEHGLSAAGAADRTSQGLVLGFVRDEVGSPLAGATVACAHEHDSTTYYFDADEADGVFSTGASANASTMAAGEAAFLVIPEECGDFVPSDGGVHAWYPQAPFPDPDTAKIVVFTAR